MDALLSRGNAAALLLIALLASSFMFFHAGAGRASAEQRTCSAAIRVTDAESEQGIYQAEVRLVAFSSGTFAYSGFTDGNGTLTFAAVEAGSYDLVVESQGYEKSSEHVDLAAGTIESFSVRLHRNAEPASLNGPGGTISAADLAVPEAARKEFESGMTTLKDNPKESIEHFRNAIQRFPKFAQAYAMLGLAYMAQKENPQASAALAKAVELNPKLSVAHTLLGKMQIEERSFAKAEVELLESIRLDPESAEAPFELARCYFNMGKLDKALEYARQANAAPQAPPNTHLLLVDIYLKKGDRQNALQELEKFAQADPNSPLMPRVQRKINQLRQQN